MVNSVSLKVCMILIYAFTVLTTFSVRGQTDVEFHTIPENFEYNFVNCIFKDHKGFLWFGTQEGLIRFDGINMYVYENDLEDTTSLSHNNILSIAEDINQNLWIGTNIGLNIYNRKKDRFQRVGSMRDELSRLSKNYVNALHFQNDSLLWIGTFGDGVHRLNIRNFSLEHFSYSATDSSGITSNRITSIGEDTLGNIWMGSQKGISVYMHATEEFRQIWADPEMPGALCHNDISEIICDKDGVIWVGTNGGGISKAIEYKDYYGFTTFDISSSPSISNNSILALCSDDEGYLWIGTDSGGLIRLDRKTGSNRTFTTKEGSDFSLNDNYISALLYDKEGRIWIGTVNKGVNVVDEKFSKFHSVRRNALESGGLTDNDIRGFAESKEGFIWVATDGGGLCKFDPVRGEIVDEICNRYNQKDLSKNAVRNVLCDTKNNIWVALWGAGIDLLDSNGKKIKNYIPKNTQGVGSKNVTGIFMDRGGNIWAGTAGSGLFIYRPDRDGFQPFHFDDSSAVLTSSSYISCLFEDSRGVYWIGTLNGLFKLKRNIDGSHNLADFRRNEAKGSISSNIIVEILEDEHENLWIATNDYGLNYYHRDSNYFTVFTKRDGLPSNTIRAITEDMHGDLWITTNRGAAILEADSLNFSIYTREDGLNSNEFYSRSAFLSSTGTLYLGGENGFNYFNPDNVKRNTIVPIVYFTNLSIDNKPAEIDAENSPLSAHISESDNIVLNASQSSFSLEYVALNYTRSIRNQYTYKLEGFDEDWIYAGNNTIARYTNIPSGKYVFKVKASNNDGIWNPVPTELKIFIKPPFWRTWQALLFYALLISAILYMSMKLWIERVNIKHRLRLEQMAHEKEHELNNRNLQWFTNISHEFRTPLSLIIGPLDSLINSSQGNIRKSLVIISRNAHRLLHLTNSLMDFRKLEEGLAKLKVREGELIKLIHEISSSFYVHAQRRNISFSVETDHNELQGWCDGQKLETIILNLLSNAFKNTPDSGKVTISIRLILPTDILEQDYNISKQPAEGRYLEIAVKDTGRGVNSDEIHHIFEKYYQSNRNVNTKNPGVGIGLSLVKGLVNLHHGDITVESKYGEFTVFRFFIPIDRRLFSSDEIDQENFAEIISEISPFPDDAEILPGADRVPEEDGDQEKRSVLLVEDNEELRNFLSRELITEYNVFVAENGKEGEEIACKEVPDLIVSDVLMPEKDGFELCSALKDDIRTSHIPIVLLTARSTDADKIEGVEKGADAYIVKPFNIQFLLSTIRQLIHSRMKLYSQFSKDVYLMPEKNAVNKRDQEFLQRAIDYIIANIENNNLNVDSLAESLNLSRSIVYRKIKTLTGTTIIEFIRTVRLKQSLKLMEEGKHSLAEIAYLTGFTSPSYFTKCFKDQYGKPPSDYLA